MVNKFKNVIILVNVILMISDGVGKVSVNILLVGFFNNNLLLVLVIS